MRSDETAGRCRTPPKAISSGGRRRYIITAEQILEVLCSTGMNWTCHCQLFGSESLNSLPKNRIWIADNYSDITEQELKWNIGDILRLTPFSGETCVRGALQDGGLGKHWELLIPLKGGDTLSKGICSM